MLLAFLLFSIAVQVWAFLPLLLFVGSFLAAVGVEEWLGLAVVPESAARTSLVSRSQPPPNEHQQP